MQRKSRSVSKLLPNLISQKKEKKKKEIMDLTVPFTAKYVLLGKS